MSGVKKQAEAKAPAAARAGGAASGAPPSLVDVFPLWELVANERDAPGAFRVYAPAAEPVRKRLNMFSRCAACSPHARTLLQRRDQGPHVRITRLRATPALLKPPTLTFDPPTNGTKPAAAAGLPTTGSAPAEKYEDALGLSLPPAAQPFLDAWKRPDELVQGAPSIPLVLLRALADGGGAGGGSGGGEKKGANAHVRAGCAWCSMGSRETPSYTLACSYAGVPDSTPWQRHTCKPLFTSRLQLIHATKGGGAGTGGKGSGAIAAAPPNRDLEGRLYAGHESFEWLLAVINAVQAAEVGTWWW